MSGQREGFAKAIRLPAPPAARHPAVPGLKPDDALPFSTLSSPGPLGIQVRQSVLGAMAPASQKRG
jgi:hypothetical protein